ncbi:hypothetical protein C2S52_010575 [Perilla frutescens var. hirtella]|nr:hypothetical protein C2S52_010575 [Perilla frutescens var. hirtella]KAH6817414.1 hypothetical protein C2S51_001017 [Perilla frutescens var. frutescens]
MQAVHASRIHHLETAYGLHIADDALPFATQLLQAYRNESTLQDMDPFQLVERACRRLRKRDLDPDSEESSLDWDEYYLDRAFVEVMELRKEKSVACRTDILPRVEKELAELTSKLECFKNKWTLVLAQQRHESAKRMVLLRCLRHEMIYFMNTTKSQGYADAEYCLQLPPLLSSLTNELQYTVHSTFKKRLIVGPCEIAQMASLLTDLPKKCFHWPFELRMMLQIKDLKSRLSKELIELDEVIHKIGFALSKQKSLRGPLGSFLLLGPHGCGRSKLAEALAKEIYGDKDRCIEVDMSKCKEPNFASKLLNFLASFKKNGSVVMFDNIENAHTSSHEVLSQILRDGRLTDGQGMHVSFSNDLVFVSSHIGHDVFCHCECLRATIPKLPFREILMEPALLHSGISDNNCHLHHFYTKVANQFKFDFLDLFNDVLVFPWLTAQNHMAISRLQMRDVAKNMCISFKKHVILYPSDAAVVNMMCYRDVLERGAHAYEDWHGVYMMPELNDVLKNGVDGILIIYIDALVGLGKEFSFRVEKGRHLEKIPILKRFKESLSKLRSSYHQEKQQVNYIYRLQTKCSRLCELIGSKAQVDTIRVLTESRDVLLLIDHIIRHEPSESNELELVQLDFFSCKAEVSSCDRKTKRAKICLEHVSRRLQSSLKQRDKATQAITEALLRGLRTSYDERSNESNHLPASFLCLGLTPKSKKQFAESLGEHLVMDDGQKLLFQVDLSLCTEPESFFWCPCSMNDLLLTEAVKKSPHSVIIFHQLEMAHVSVFSTILSILDDGVAKDSEGNMTSFENCVVVFVLDLGNKDIIGKLNRDCPEIKWPSRMEAESTSEEGAVGSSLTDEMAKQEVVGSPPTSEMGLRGLRFEFLYRLDQLLLFDPFSDDQLNQFVMLPMKSLVEKSHSLYKTFSELLNVQGKKILKFVKNAAALMMLMVTAVYTK